MVWRLCVPSGEAPARQCGLKWPGGCDPSSQSLYFRVGVHPPKKYETSWFFVFRGGGTPPQEIQEAALKQPNLEIQSCILGGHPLHLSDEGLCPLEIQGMILEFGIQENQLIALTYGLKAPHPKTPRLWITSFSSKASLTSLRFHMFHALTSLPTPFQSFFHHLSNS